MGSWGITMRESDYGLDLLDVLVDGQLADASFECFNASQAIECLRQTILDEIKQSHRGCKPDELDFYVQTNFPHNFTQAALLIAECAGDYYRNGELVVNQYVGKTYEPVEQHISKFAITSDDLSLLLGELRSVQEPGHWLYQSWFREDDRQKWLGHIKGLCTTLEKHRHDMVQQKDGQSLKTSLTPTAPTQRGMEGMSM